MAQAYRILYIAALICLGTGMFFALFRAIKGPRIADRIVGINMLNTMAILCIAICAFLLNEPWLLDVCLVYGMIGFLAVLVLSMIHIDAKHRPGKKENTDER